MTPAHTYYKITENTKRHCARFEHCKGCRVECSAPLAPWNSQEHQNWVNETNLKVIKLYGANENE